MKKQEIKCPMNKNNFTVTHIIESIDKDVSSEYRINCTASRDHHSPAPGNHIPSPMSQLRIGPPYDKSLLWFISPLQQQKQNRRN